MDTPTSASPTPASTTTGSPQPPLPTKPVEPAKMVGWYDPSQLLRTGVEVFLSTVFGRHADHRLIEALASASDKPYDHTCVYKHAGDGQYIIDETQVRQEIWIDYVGDVGDGWNSTYTVAYYLAQPELTVQDPQGQEHRVQRGDILIFGGDEVYPTPSPMAYEQRLVEPYETALRYTNPPHPHAYAIPGNHDWYDSLVAYTRLFCSSSRPWFAGWRTQQRRSYFALKLPHRWWLLGTDVQLGSDIDQPQVEFFQKVAADMQEGDHIILCNAEPHWIRAKIYSQYDPDANENNLAYLESKILGKNVAVFIAGDLHHYRRHAAADGTQKITAGGDGAFLHPTHGQDVDTLMEEDKHRAVKRTFDLKKSFPDPTTSWWLCWRNLLFPYYNPTFGIVTAILYVLTSWAVLAPIERLGIHKIGLAAETTLRTALSSPVAAFWGAAMFFGFVLFTDTYSKLYRWIMGPIHGLIHVIGTFFVGWGAAYLCVSVLGLTFMDIPQLLLSGGLIFIGGYVIGSIIMGLYLLVSLNVFGRHSNEAFSSLKIPDWKNFLKLRIDANGDLTIFPIGIRRVARHWQERPTGATGPELVPDDPKAPPPELIELPIPLQRPTT